VRVGDAGPSAADMGTHFFEGCQRVPLAGGAHPMADSAMPLARFSPFRLPRACQPAAGCGARPAQKGFADHILRQRSN